MTNQNLWLVWSYEHNAWWGPGKCGYTKDWQKAGRYRYSEAMQICVDANRYTEQTNEEMVHVHNVENGYWLPRANFMAKKKMPEKMQEKAEKMKEKAAPAKKAEKK
jgi:hypothetical protein